MESKEVVYVGSTTNFSQRKAKHKYLWNKEGKEFKYPIYCHIRDDDRILKILRASHSIPF